MALVTRREEIKQKTVSKKLLCFTTVLGVFMLIIPVVLIYFDPVLYAVQHMLRLENGSLLHELLLSRFTSTKISLYLFNVTNAEQFLGGADEKVHLEEIGPFVYQEYRSHSDLEINRDPGIMRYTPKLETKFIPEESIGDHKNFNLTVPNIAMLAATSMISKYPFMVRQIYNMVAASSGSRPFVALNAYEDIYGYYDPLIELANKAVPGLIYFKSLGQLERLYDIGADYRLELGTTYSDKFSVKKATKIQPKNQSASNTKIIIESTYTYNNTYEGAVFPPNLTPEQPINIYRQGLCKTFHLAYHDSKRMPHGGDGFVYHFHNETFRDREQCDTKGWCPEGLMNVANCFFGFPIALSKGHFLDSDPRLLQMVEGLKPNRSRHGTHLIVDPIIGIGIAGSMSLQLNLVLADVGFNPHTRRLKDTVLPVSNIIVSAPPMIKEVSDVLNLMYKQRPIIILSAQVTSTLLGTLLLLYTTRKLFIRTWLRNQTDVKKTQPLLTN